MNSRSQWETVSKYNKMDSSWEVDLRLTFGLNVDMHAQAQAHTRTHTPDTACNSSMTGLRPWLQFWSSSSQRKFYDFKKTLHKVFWLNFFFIKMSNFQEDHLKGNEVAVWQIGFQSTYLGDTIEPVFGQGKVPVCVGLMPALWSFLHVRFAVTMESSTFFCLDLRWTSQRNWIGRLTPRRVPGAFAKL